MFDVLILTDASPVITIPLHPPVEECPFCGGYVEPGTRDAIHVYDHTDPDYPIDLHYHVDCAMEETRDGFLDLAMIIVAMCSPGHRINVG